MKTGRELDALVAVKVMGLTEEARHTLEVERLYGALSKKDKDEGERAALGEQ